MKKVLLIVAIMFSMMMHASSWYTTFEEAQRDALASNRLIIVDFWATWCGPCKQMDMNTWSSQELKETLQSFVLVKIDIDTNKEFASKYSVEAIPNMFVMDANGKVIYSFLGYRNPGELLQEIKNYELSTEYLSVELINRFKTPTFNTSLRLVQKYFDYSLYVDKDVKSNIMMAGVDYLKDAKRQLQKKDEDFLDKKQKIELLEIYEYVYKFNFEKVNKKLLDIKESEITESNKNNYYFLKYITSKALNKDDFSQIEEITKQLEGFDYFLAKAQLILSKRV